MVFRVRARSCCAVLDAATNAVPATRLLAAVTDLSAIQTLMTRRSQRRYLTEWGGAGELAVVDAQRTVANFRP